LRHRGKRFSRSERGRCGWRRPTSELVLWHAIRGRRLGMQFRRQVPLGGRYIADLAGALALIGAAIAELRR
jgi:very-short-patch-repair endonuclease